jgi:myo-inositol 2-dehydrogenase/D-chiro-inositol 1-dehydrogenase
VRVGLVGAGWIAREHRRVLDDAAGVELAAVCDTDLGRAAALADGTGARTYGDWRELLEREDLGALFVCTPPRSHREPAVAALRSGLPVYLEKPIARTPSDAADIVAAAAGTVCAVGYQWHALDLLLELPGLLAGQQIGLLTGTSIGPTQSRPWFTDMRAGGGNLLERGSHHLDLIRAVAGEVTAVQAAASRIRLARGADDAGDIDDALTVLLSLASGAVATVTIAWTRPGQPGSYGLDIIASEATLRLALDPDFTLSGVSRGQPVTLASAARPFGRSVRRFLDAVRGRDPAAVACTPADAAATLAVAAAAEQALRTARAVPVAALLPAPAGLPASAGERRYLWRPDH